MTEMIDEETFDWQEYYDTHPDYQKRVDIILDPKEMSKYAPPPLHVQIKEMIERVKIKIKKNKG